MIITIDFETYYTQDYSLKEMSTEAYIKDPKFEVIGVGISLNGKEPSWFPQPQVYDVLHSIDWSNNSLLAFNTAFDGAILGWRYGLYPALYLDAMGMAKALNKTYKGASLGKLVESLGIGTKGEYAKEVKSKRFADFTEQELKEYGEYCCNDVKLTIDLYKKLAPNFPKQEFLVQDANLRLFIEPTVYFDSQALEEYRNEVVETKHKRLIETGKLLQLDWSSEDELKEKLRTILASQNKFAEILQSFGIDPPTKLSSTTAGKIIWAFAKTDQEFIALQEHEDTTVQALVTTRLGVRSTIEETRATTFLDVAQRGAIPIIYNYCGANTTRFSGGEPGNLQNLKRGGKLRDAILPPPGHVFVCADLSAIECVVGSTLVLTKDRGYVKIPEILKTDLLWDGMEWVCHDGVVYKGEKEVITYDGITGTPNHRVYLSDGRRVYLKDAQTTGAALCISERNGKAIRILDSTRKTNSLKWTSNKTLVLLWFVSARTISRYSRFACGPIFKLSRTCATKTYIANKDTFKKIRRNTSQSKFKFYKSRLYLLQTSRHSKQIYFKRRIYNLCFKEFTTRYLQKYRNRQNKKRWTLRTWKFTISYAIRKCQQTMQYYLDCLSRATNIMYQFQTNNGFEVWIRYDSQICKRGLDRRTNNRTRTNILSQTKLENTEIRTTRSLQTRNETKKKERVYDIINSGPRNRFTANGRLISNCRLVNYLAGQDDIVEAFRQYDAGIGESVYCILGRKIFGKPVIKGINEFYMASKVAELSSGFGGGWEAYKRTLFKEAGQTVSEADARAVVQVYRDSHPQVRALWRQGDQVLRCLIRHLQFDLGRSGILDGSHPEKGIGLPSGLYIHYPELRQEADENGEVTYYYTATKQGRPYKKKIYGSVVIQNCVEGLSRTILTDAWMRLRNKVRVVMHCHDELVGIAPFADVERIKETMFFEMTKPIEWAPGLPILCEVTHGKNYGSAK